jgi:hypothetical protein
LGVFEKSKVTLGRKPQGRRAAREMAAMHRGINEQLEKMENLTADPNRAINCSTCHRGAIDPTASDR